MKLSRCLYVLSFFFFFLLSPLCLQFIIKATVDMDIKVCNLNVWVFTLFLMADYLLNRGPLSGTCISILYENFFFFLDLRIDRLRVVCKLVCRRLDSLTFREWNHLCFSSFHIDCWQTEVSIHVSCLFFLPLPPPWWSYHLWSSCWGSLLRGI